MDADLKRAAGELERNYYSIMFFGPGWTKERDTSTVDEGAASTVLNLSLCTANEFGVSSVCGEFEDTKESRIARFLCVHVFQTGDCLVL